MVNSPIAVVKASKAALMMPGIMLGNMTVKNVLHQFDPRLDAASERTFVLIARKLLSIGRYINGSEIMTYAKIKSPCVSAIVNGGLLSNGTMPNERILIQLGALPNNSR